jgi:magnesium transporter
MRKRFSLQSGQMVPVAADAEAAIEVFCSPTDAEKKHLIDVLKIDEHTLASALDPDELSRLEFEPDHRVIIFNRPKAYAPTKRRTLGIGSVGLFLYGDRMVIVMSDDDDIFGGLAAKTTNGFNSLALRILNRSIYHFTEHLRIINKMGDEIQDKLASSLENKYLLKMFELQRSMVYYQSSINSNQALIEKLRLNATKFAFTTEEIELLDDISIENNQCGKLAEINANILAGLMDARASIVNNNINILMKMLNLITIGIMVPTLVVSAFSMNVPIPLAGHAHAFWIVMALAAASVAGLVAYLRWKKW